MTTASNEFHTGDYINCFLVDKEIRDGFLFQTIDYNEYSPEEPKSKEFLLLVKKYFEKLNHLSFNQGVLLSRKVFDKTTIETDLGKILGFPCECPVYPSKVIRYGYDIIVVLKSSIPEFPDVNVNIISFMSLDVSHSQTELLTQNIKNILLNDDTFELRSRVIDVKLEITPIFPESHFINALLQPDYKFTEHELYELTNIWYNQMGETQLNEFKLLLDDKKQITNLVNRGIIIGILLVSENNPTRVFYPIQNNGVKKMNEYDKIHDELETRMMEILKKPKHNYKCK